MSKKFAFIIGLLWGILLGLGIGIMAGLFLADKATLHPIADPVPTKAAISSVPTTTGVPSPEPTATVIPSPTLTATATPTPEPTVTPTPTVTAKPTATSAPTPTVTAKPTATSAPTPTATPEPTVTPTPTKKPENNDTSETTNDFYGALHVEGTHLAAEDGTLVQLKGISTHGLGWFPDYVNEKMIAQVKQEWGCNVFRLAMYTADYNGYCTSDAKQKKNLKDLIDTGVRAAVEQEMYVIIDWHILNDSNPNTYKEEAKKFFGEMAKKYKDVPNVIYEICNEPNGGTGWSTIKQYALEVIPEIRKHAPEAIIIVGTPTWSQDVDVAAKDPITEYDNIMYALHFYAATHKDSLRDKCKTAVAKGLPLFVTEYGICDASGNGAIDETQANQWIAMLDGYGISHVMWNLSNKAETSAVVKSSCSKTSNLTINDLSEAGLWFVAMMQRSGLGSENWVVPDMEDGNAEDSNGNTGSENAGGNTGQTTQNIPTVEELFEKTDKLEVTISNGWVSETGYGIQLNVVVKNSGTKEEPDWKRELKIKPGKNVTVSQCWCAKVTVEGRKLIFKPEDYNKTIPANGEVSGIGIILEVK